MPNMQVTEKQTKTNLAGCLSLGNLKSEEGMDFHNKESVVNTDS